MVNANYLENLARHRFGVSPEDEKYLDKFVDIRLKLSPKEGYIKSAVAELARELPLAIPYGERDAFSIEHAAILACELAEHTKLSMRKIKRILLKEEVALRCYADQPLDASLLVFLAFRDEMGDVVTPQFLPRSELTPEVGERGVEDMKTRSPNGRSRDPDYSRIQNYPDWAEVFKFLAPHYVPSHRAVLDTVASVTVSSE